MESQKLTSWDAVPEATSRFNLVTDWISLIQRLTSDCSRLRNASSVNNDAGWIESMVNLFPDALALSTARCMAGWMMRWVSGISTFCCKCKSESSSSANLRFATGMPTVLDETCQPNILARRTHQDSPICASPAFLPPMPSMLTPTFLELI